MKNKKEKKPWEWWPTWLIALSGWAMVVVLIVQGSCDEPAVLTRPRVSDVELSTLIQRELNDYSRYLENAEKRAYTNIRMKLSELSTKGMARSSFAGQTIDGSVRSFHDSLNHAWRSMKRESQNILFSAGLRDTSIQSVPFLSSEWGLYVRLMQESAEAKKRVEEFAMQKKKTLGLIK